MKRLFVFFVVVVALVGCGQPEKDLTLKMRDGLSGEEVKRATEGVKTLTDSCPGIARYWGDLTQVADVTISQASATDEREHGWKEVVAVEIQVVDKPQKIPASYRATGNRCYFDMGTSAPLGVSVGKSACISVCRDKQSAESLALVQAK